MERTPPPGVPADAVWSAAQNEWEWGQKDAQGRYQGEVRYWRNDGTLANVDLYVDGVPHGEFKRFHESGEVSQSGRFERGVIQGTRTWYASDKPTTERMHNPRQSKNIRRIEIDYRDGLFYAMRSFDRQGARVNDDGSPYRPPPGVPDHAHFNGKVWIAGVWNEKGQKNGEFTEWDADGILTGKYSALEDALDGSFVLYAKDGRPISEKHYARGVLEGACVEFYDDGSKRSEIHYRAGKLDGVAQFWRRDGSLARRATLREGAYGGSLQDFDVAGRMLREVNHAAPSGDAEPAAKVEDGPAAELARAIAMGWGGDEDRDAEQAREQRRLVRRTAPESVQARLRVHGLDRAPRLLTAERLERVLQDLGQDPAIDARVLRACFVAAGGAGTTAGLGAGGAEAKQLLEQRITGSSLSLSRAALTRLPAEVALLPSLTRIDASYNHLRALPPEVGDVLLLDELDLKGNRIEELPAELGMLSLLRYLSLDENELERVPPSLCGLEQIRTLNLANNRLRDLPEEFCGLTQLGTLWLHENPLQTLPRSMARMRKLTFLHLGDIEWPEPPSVVFEIESLEELWLASSHLKRLSPAIAQLRRLRMLSIWNSALEELPEEIFHMQHLRELRVTDNPLPKPVYERLREALPDCKIY